jgi:hypothetical protein
VNPAHVIWLAIGFMLAMLLLLYTRSRKPAGEKNILSIALMIAAFIYVAFALAWSDWIWVFVELAGVGLYGVFVWLAFSHSSYWLAVGWLVHPIWDVLLHLQESGNAVAPEWYAVVCISFDALVAVYIAVKVKKWQSAGLA